MSAIRQQRRQLKKNLLDCILLTLDTSHLLRSALNRNAAGSHAAMPIKRCRKPCGGCQRCGVSNPATAKATQKELTLVQRCDFGHVPLAEIRIELAGIDKTLHRKPCGNDATMWVSDVVSAIRQQRRQLKKNLLPYILLTLDTSHLLRSALNWPA